MGIVVVGVVLIGLAGLVVCSEALNRVMAEPPEPPTASSGPDPKESGRPSERRAHEA